MGRKGNGRGPRNLNWLDLMSPWIRELKGGNQRARVVSALEHFRLVWRIGVGLRTYSRMEIKMIAIENNSTLTVSTKKEVSTLLPAGCELLADSRCGSRMVLPHWNRCGLFHNPTLCCDAIQRKWSGSLGSGDSSDLFNEDGKWCKSRI